MAKKNLLGLSKLVKTKRKRPGRHSKAHKAKKFSRGQGNHYEKILWLQKRKWI
jgi:hypothetical protein